MKTGAVRAAPRYRNDVVFRSAERLLASQPRKPAVKLPSRSAVFLLGIACGVGAAWGLLRSSSESAPSVAEATTPSVGSRKPLSFHLRGAGPTFGASAPAIVPPSPVAPNPVRPTTPAATQRSAAIDAPARSSVAAPPARTVARAPATAVGTPPVSVVTRLTTQFKLRGEIAISGQAPLPVEFELRVTPHRIGGTVEGVAQLFAGSAAAETIKISGNLINHTMTLSETTKGPPSGASYMATRHLFVIEFPARDDTAPITGRWTHRNGVHRGTLRLTGVAPL